MEPLDLAARYFDAWNRRDPEAIAAVFTDDGTYTDPNVPAGIGPQATAEYARGLFQAFPDLAFEIQSSGERGDGTVAAQWTMTGTNAGPFQGLPPSGRAVRLPGADVIAVDGDRVPIGRGLLRQRGRPAAARDAGRRAAGAGGALRLRNEHLRVDGRPATGRHEPHRAGGTLA
jgi:steroid delta-isomerase-like uncharacterized protein